MRSLAAAIVVLLGFVFAATAQGWAVKYASGPDPAVARWPSWPYPTSCLGVSFDPIAVFAGPTEAENGSGGPELALRKYLDEGLYPQVPTRFWRLVSASETRAQFASGRLEQGLFWLSFELSDGQWRVVGDLDECRARTLRGGNVAVRWDLEPGRHLTAKTRRIQVKLHDGPGCDGGRELAAAAEPPEFLRAGRKLVIVIWLEPLPPGPYPCKRRRAQPTLRVALPGPLGDRQLWDGGTFPPRRER